MMLLRGRSIFYFNVKRTIWLKSYQNSNHIEPSEQRLREISIAKNLLVVLFLRCSDGSMLVAVLVTLKPDSTLNVEI